MSALAMTGTKLTLSCSFFIVMMSKGLKLKRSQNVELSRQRSNFATGASEVVKVFFPTNYGGIQGKDITISGNKPRKALVEATVKGGMAKIFGTWFCENLGFLYVTYITFPYFKWSFPGRLETEDSSTRL